MIKITMQTKKEIIIKNQERYLKASKNEKSKILDEVCNTTGLSRNRTIRLLHGSAKFQTKLKKGNRGRKIIYSLEVIEALKKIWTLLDFACGKRLKAAMIPFLDALERHNKLNFEPHVIDKLRTISAASIDRLLKPSRTDSIFKGKSTTKPGTLLKKNIPIRLGNQWDENKPGFVEIDLVAHCGDTTAGEYVNTLDVTDIYSGWTETRAILTKAQKHTFDALFFIENQAPFNYLGIDSDNGSEFINHQLFRYCQEHNICFTRSRPFRKNDNCHVEQKNWQVIRRHIGYDRYESKTAVDLLNQYYQALRLYNNFFLPQTKLIERKREGTKIKKVYDSYLTPYQRILNSKDISDKVKKELANIYLSLNPFKLQKEMIDILEKLKKESISWGSCNPCTTPVWAHSFSKLNSNLS